ncbi:MAG: SEC-C metal-binding domain-containing protein [Armatimonadetes bacterium]|nr:SEC-C metal-binding domain-containing protein [Armatimonadota bacterium]MDW8122170.1 SEC-C metal-binding domain-containing protein [Armatimonadota bacterium]
MVGWQERDWWDILSKFIGPIRKIIDPNEWVIRRLRKRIQAINALESEVSRWKDEDFFAKTQEFRYNLQKYTEDIRREYEEKLQEYRQCTDPEQRFALEPVVARLDTAVKKKEQEYLASILPLAFAMVREASRRTIGLRHFDVQLMGGIVLHEGKIAEMKTGEGKTLVATLPVYLNALTGRGVQVVTVNDYLAKRDAQWMGPIYTYLGLTCGFIQHDTPREERKNIYAGDVTYVTNSQLGFDYLNDNLSPTLEGVVLRDLFYAIVDEVDNILIDEARTPHIIGGFVEKPTDFIEKADRIVRQLRVDKEFTVDEKHRTVSLTDEGVRRVEELWGLTNLSDPINFPIYHALMNALRAHHLYKNDVHYVVKDNEVIIVDEFTGRLQWGRRWSDGLHQAVEAKEGIKVQQEMQTVATITLQNFFRMYFKLAGMTGTAKTEEREFIKIYGMPVVVIPTHKPMIRKDYPDVVYKTEAAKFRGIVEEILHLYISKRPVLVGTRSIEVNEKVSSLLAPAPLQALVLSSLVLDRAWDKEKKKEISQKELDEIRAVINVGMDKMEMGRVRQFARKLGLPPDPLDLANLKAFAEGLGLKDDALQEALPLLEQALKEGIPHNVLNAKHHEREAQIIAEAGRLAKVTVATNMAGRGVDIILGGKPDPENAPEEICRDPNCKVEFQHNAEYHEVVKRGGLHVLGTERHEARRIDNQLRGRSGRQGDPGSSRFYLSLEDELWRLYSDPNLKNHPLLKSWPEELPIAGRFLSKGIEVAQKRVEAQNFEIRRHVLQYDDVLNIQREVIYANRRKILQGADMKANILEFLQKTIQTQVDLYLPDGVAKEEWDYDGLVKSLAEILPVGQIFRPEDILDQPKERLVSILTDGLTQYYEAKEQRLGSEFMRALERWALLRVIDEKWRDHLANMEYLREHIGLRGYAQRDPLVEYRKEAYEMFQEMLQSIRQETLRWTFFLEPVEERELAARSSRVVLVEREDGDGVDSRKPQKTRPTRSAKKVGRNDPCPCGSGKKFKKCCMLKGQPTGS